MKFPLIYHSDVMRVDGMHLNEFQSSLNNIPLDKSWIRLCIRNQLTCILKVGRKTLQLYSWQASIATNASNSLLTAPNCMQGQERMGRTIPQ